MSTVKLGDAISYYRGIRQDIIDRKNEIIKQRNSLQKSPEKGEGYAEEIATLELSLEGLKKQEEENYKKLNALNEQYAAVWNAEVAKQQGDAYKQMAEDMAKILEVARRIANGDKVPSSDEQKLLEYSAEMYQAAKSMAVMNAMKEHKEYSSLWEDEEEKTEYDPQGKAENAEVDADISGCEAAADQEMDIC